MKIIYSVISAYQNLFSMISPVLQFKFKYYRVKLIIEEIEREELAWREDLYSSDRKFAEYYNVRRAVFTWSNLWIVRYITCFFILLLIYIAIQGFGADSCCAY